MSDLPPPPPGDDVPPPPPPGSPPPGGPAMGGPPVGVGPTPTPFGAVGVVPPRLGGAYYSTGLVIFLTIITLGIWGALWTYRTSEDLKKYNGDGLGGVLGVVLYVLQYVGIPSVIALFFTIPNEIKHMYERDGRQRPITAVWGLWFLLPLIGNIVWYVKVQRCLNDFWRSKGALPD